MNYLYEHNNNLYISNPIYNLDKNIKTLFKKKPKTYKPVYISSSSEDENDQYLEKSNNYLLEDSVDEDFVEYTNEYPNEFSEIGGKTEKKSRKSKKKTSKLFSKIKYMKIMPTFINVIKGRILYNNRSKFTIEPLIPSDYKNVVLGILIDLYKVEETVEDVTLNKIENYIKSYDVVPLLYNDTSNVIYKNKKTHFFSKTSKLCFITFKMPANYKYYIENINLEPLSKLHDIDETKLTENSLIAHFIYENYYFLHTNPKKLKIDKCYLIDIETMEFKEIEKIKSIKPNERNLTIDEVYAIIKKGKSMLKF